MVDDGSMVASSAKLRIGMWYSNATVLRKVTQSFDPFLYMTSPSRGQCILRARSPRVFYQHHQLHFAETFRCRRCGALNVKLRFAFCEAHPSQGTLCDLIKGVCACSFLAWLYHIQSSKYLRHISPSLNVICLHIIVSSTVSLDIHMYRHGMIWVFLKQGRPNHESSDQYSQLIIP